MSEELGAGREDWRDCCLLPGVHVWSRGEWVCVYMHICACVHACMYICVNLAMYYFSSVNLFTIKEVELNLIVERTLWTLTVQTAKNTIFKLVWIWLNLQITKKEESELEFNWKRSILTRSCHYWSWISNKEKRKQLFFKLQILD